MAKKAQAFGGNATGALKGFIKELDAIADEKDELNTRAKEITQAAREAGFKPNVIRAVVRRRRMGEEKRREFDDLLESYEGAVS